ncbi:MAG: ATP-binding protein [Micavibrio aeruginosavorus]|uniref:ATP-binding protein n=1 Tax=Micavibrio aeruginosavorus TaxID=349221 RepID=A0A2W5FNE9_9BACT|nr:MAG: ATP-binding protein [Micavibrio aeruginosavorus]
MTSDTSFIDTHQYRLFSEFCDTCASYKYIGICYGPPGVGKTLSARRYANWDKFSRTKFSLSDSQCHEYFRASRSVHCTTVLYTAPVTIHAKTLSREIDSLRERIRISSPEMVRLNKEQEYLLAQAKIKRERERKQFEKSQINKITSCEEYETPPTVYDIQTQSTTLRKSIKDPTKLIIIDETERLSPACLDQVRYIYDLGGIGIVLIGMPGLEKRLARYAQLSSRVGFVHKFSPLSADQVRKVWTKLRSSYLNTQKSPISDEAMTAIIRMTRGNFRLLERLLSQIERVLEINKLSEITLEVVEVARENLVIGAA